MTSSTSWRNLRDSLRFRDTYRVQQLKWPTSLIDAKGWKWVCCGR